MSVPKPRRTQARQRCGHCGPACSPSAQSSAGSPASSSTACSALFFRGFNWVFDVTINVYGRMVAGLLRVSVDRAAGLRRPDGPDLLRLSSRARSASFPSRTRATWSSTPSFPTAPPGPHRRGRPRDEQDRPRSAGRRPHDRPARLLDRAEHEHQQRRRHVRDPRAVRGARRQRRSSARPRSSRRLREKFSTITDGARRRVRRAAGRGPGQHRRLQAAGAGPPQCRAAFAAGRRREPRRRGQPRSAAGRPVHQLQRHPAAALRRRRRGEGQGPGDHAQGHRRTLQAYLGSFYVNDFFFQNRNWQVNVQAAPRYRMQIEDIGNLEVRNGDGQARAAAHVDQRPQRQRPGDRQPLQPVPVGRDQRQHRARRQLRPGDRHHGQPGRRRRCPPRWASSGPS